MNARSVLIDEIRSDAERADALQRQSRDLLIEAVQRASAAGMTQREIARAVGRSQPEVSRLLRVARQHPLARVVRERRAQVLAVLSRHDVTDVRLFGSVATGEERSGSDIDLLIDTPHTLGLGTLSRLEQELAGLLDAEVDLVPLRSLPAYMRERALAQAVPL